MNERVLLVEDDASIREVTSEGVARAGFRVDATGDGRDALARFAQSAPDVVLDVMLPSLDGYEVCRQIPRRSQAPIVMLSARTDTVDETIRAARARRSPACRPPQEHRAAVRGCQS
jgi:two-component system response regulator MtrA